MSSERVLVSKRVVLINSMSQYAQRFLTLTIFFWVQQYLIRRVPAEELEALTVVQSLMLYIPLISLLVVSGIGRYVTESFAQADDRRVTQIISSMAPITFGIGLLMAGAGAVLVWRLDDVLRLDPRFLDDARIMFSILVAAVCMRVVTLPFGVGVHVRQKYLQLTLIGLLSEVIRISVLFALLLGVSTRALWLVIAQVPSLTFELVFSVWYSKRLVPAIKFRPKEFRMALVRPILSFGGWTLLGRLVAVGRETVGALSLNRFGTPADVVSFRTGALVETRLFPTILAPLVTAQTAVTTMHATGQDERLKRYFLKVSRYIGWAFFLAAFPMVVFRDELWILYLGREKALEYAATGTVMTLLLVKCLVTFPQPIVAQVALAKAEQRPAQLRVMAIEGLAILATLWFVVVGQRGAVGAALGTMVVTMVLAPLLHWDYGIRLVRSSWGEFLRSTLAPALLPALIATPVWILLRGVAPQDTWLRLLESFAGGALVYAAGVWAVLRPEERKDAGRIFRRLVPVGRGARA